jgi:hypothetical protein
MSLLSRVDNKLFHNKSKQDAYSKARSHIKMQLWIALIMFGIAVTSCMYFLSEATWMLYTIVASNILSSIINTVMRFQYVNAVLMVKQRFQLVGHLLSEAAIKDDGNSSTRTDKEHFRSSRNINSNRPFPITTFNWKSGTCSNNYYTIRDLQLICSELCDVMHTNNKSFELLILLDVIIILTNTVPTTYSGFVTLKRAIVDNSPIQLYLRAVTIFLQCAVMLLALLWLTMCCQKTTEEVSNIFIGIQKLLLYPNELGWSTSELKSFCFQIKNNKAEFNVCGFFTLNLQFFCASVSVVFTYILVLHQLS